MVKILIANCREHGVYMFDSRGAHYFVKYPPIEEEEVVESSPKEGELYMNIVQRSMYRRVMYGLKNYSEEQLKSMTDDAKFKIDKDYKYGVRVLNKLKLQVFYEPYNKLIKAMLPHFKEDEEDYMYHHSPPGVTLKKLNISTKRICEELIKYDLLPKNFFEIEPENLKL